MDVTIVLLSESFVASFIGARDLLALLKSRSRMLSLNMLLQFSLTRTFSVAEWAIGVFLLDMVLKFSVGREAEMDGTSVCVDAGQCAIGAKISGETMHAIFMLAEGN